jgi:FtsZ-binding cell division protein ZapB
MTMRPRSTEAQRTLERTDQIIKQILETKEVKIKPEAREFGGPSGTLGMADMIANIMSQYKEDKVKLAEYLVAIKTPNTIWLNTQQSIDQMMADILQTAQDFLRAIDKAYSYDLIEEGETVKCRKELDELKKKNVELAKRNVDVTAALETCKRENEVLRKDNDGLRKILGKNSQLGGLSP